MVLSLIVKAERKVYNLCMSFDWDLTSSVRQYDDSLDTFY